MCLTNGQSKIAPSNRARITIVHRELLSKSSPRIALTMMTVVETKKMLKREKFGIR